MISNLIVLMNRRLYAANRREKDGKIYVYVSKVYIIFKLLYITMYK